MMQEHSFVLAVKKLLGIEVPSGGMDIAKASVELPVQRQSLSEQRLNELTAVRMDIGDGSPSNLYRPTVSNAFDHLASVLRADYPCRQ